jgi:FtsH-binding integral membrane protein
MDIESGVAVSLVGNDQVKYLAQADDMIRRGFIKKVYGILSVQLLMTFGISFVIYNAGKGFIRQNPWVAAGGVIAALSLLLVVFCAPSLARTYPMNYVFLVFFTAFESLAVAAISAEYDVESVLIAVALTGLIFITMTFLALIIDIDLTTWLSYLTIVLLGLVFTSIAVFFMGVTKHNGVIAGSGAVIFGLYIVIDTQRIVRGEKDAAHSFRVDDYVLAAIEIYLDVINIFVYMLRLFGNRR